MPGRFHRNLVFAEDHHASLRAAIREFNKDSESSSDGPSVLAAEDADGEASGVRIDAGVESVWPNRNRWPPWSRRTARSHEHHHRGDPGSGTDAGRILFREYLPTISLRRTADAWGRRLTRWRRGLPARSRRRNSIHLVEDSPVSGIADLLGVRDHRERAGRVVRDPQRCAHRHQRAAGDLRARRARICREEVRPVEAAGADRAGGDRRRGPPRPAGCRRHRGCLAERRPDRGSTT